MKFSINSKCSMILVIALLLGVVCYHGHYKEYLYEDEVLSYTIANSTKGGFINLSPGKIYSGEELYAYTYVEKGQEFDYRSVIANHKVDAHPPLYGLILHTICSIWSGSFSKWFGLGINLVLFAALLVLLYLLVHYLFPKRAYFPAFVCLVFGITTGVIFLTVFIRMYMLFMALTTACMYWHIRKFENQITISSCILLCILTYAGAMTHYFYLIFAFFCACFWLLNKIKHKSVKDIVRYVLSMMAAGILILLSWHDVIFDMFKLDAASDLASQKLTVMLMIRKNIQMVRNINCDLFGNRLKYVVLIVLIFFVFLMVKKRESLRGILHVKPEFRFIILVSVPFFVVVSAITPYMTSRYVSPVFPYVILFTVITLEQITNETIKYPILGLIIIFTFFAIPEISALQNGLYDDNRMIIDSTSTEHKDDFCMFGYGIAPEENVFELRKFHDIYVYDGWNAVGAAEDISQAHEIVVYVPEGDTPEEYIKDIQTVNPKLMNMERLYVAYYSTAYLLYE